MHRLTARLLLLFALVGNFVPVALASIALPTPKCCLRKAVHHCHGSTYRAEDELSIRSTSCCSHDCCRAATPAHWAHPQIKNRAIARNGCCALVAASRPASLSAADRASLSARAPPQSFTP